MLLVAPKLQILEGNYRFPDFPGTESIANDQLTGKILMVLDLL